jgi:hypothetical protein
MSHPTSRVTPGPYLILDVSIENAVSSGMTLILLFQIFFESRLACDELSRAEAAPTEFI